MLAGVIKLVDGPAAELWAEPDKEQMPFHFQWNAVQVLWTLTFAALLVLLVVLLGRDRTKRFPLFTFSIAVIALRLLVSRLLFGRLSPMALSVVFYSLAILASLASLLVIVELARHAFAGVNRKAMGMGSLGVLAVAGIALAEWGPWPAWATLTAGGSLLWLRFMELAGQRGEMLVGLLAVELGILVALLGRRFHGGWRSHTQQIVLGLSTAAISQLAVRGIWQAIALKAVVHNQSEYEHVMGIQDKLYNGNNVVFILVLIWWIACLWRDEPGSAVAAAAGDPVHVDPIAVLEDDGGK